MNQLYTADIRDFGTLASSIETTDMAQGRLVLARNCLLRPKGAIKGIPKYTRLWATFSSETAQAKYRSLPFTGYSSGVGVDSAARAANKTIAVRIYRQGKNFLVFYDLTQSKARGLFYLGDDGTFTSGAYTFAAGPPTYEVLAVGLDPNARWYGKRMATQLMLSNNVDTPVCVQLGRTATPGKWRQAGSNAAPAAATISQVVPANSTNVQASLTLQGGAQGVKVVADPATDKLWVYTAAATLAVDTTTDRVTFTGFTPFNGQRIILAGTTAPGGLTFYTQYYCINCAGSSAQISLVLTGNNTGAPIDITTSGTAVSAFAITANNLAINETLLFQSSGTLPGGLTAGATYYARNVTLYNFQVSTSSDGSAVDITDTGTPIDGHSFLSLQSTRRAGTASLTFTADVDNFPGAAGNSVIQVRIVNTTYATTITSSRTGIGTLASPIVYTINTGGTAESSSNDAVVAYVNSDTLAVGVLRASTSAASSVFDPMNLEATFLSGGSGSGVSEGLTSQTCTVYLRYFDTGNERLGYEGISSPISNTVILDENTRADILVTITPNPSAEGGRFDTIRVYFQFGEGAAAVWNLVGEVPNTSGTKTIQVGTNTEIGQAMAVDQNRPLPYKDNVMVGSQVWYGGNASNPDLLYVSKAATDDEIAPEGANAESPELITMSRQTSRLKVTALYTDDFRLHVHTNNGVILLNPSDPTADKHIPQVSVGALNPACITDFENSRIFFLGSDLQIYEFSGARYGRRNIAASTKDAIEYILDVANIDKIGQQPDRVNTWIDLRAELYWYSFPGQDDTLTSFAFDFQNNGVVGEFSYPKVYATAKMEAERPEVVFIDEDGNLFFMDSREQNDSGDELSASSPYTTYSTSAPIPVQFAGYGYVDRGGVRYYQAVETVIETGFIDLGRLSQFKQFAGILFSTVKNSRALVDITITNKSGFSVTRSLSDIYSTNTQQVRKIMAQLGGEAVKVRFNLLAAEQSPWIIRNLSLLYRSAGQL